MLQNNFFDIVDSSQKEATYSTTIKINPQHQVFEGHFPNQPVVPGVFTLQVIKEILENKLQKQLRYASLSNCKFSNVIIPEKDLLINVEYEYQLMENDVQVKVSVKSGEMTYLSLKGKLSLV